MESSTTDAESIVVPTGYDPASYPCVRSLGKRGVNVILASEHDNVHASASRFCSETVRIPAPGDSLVAYKDALVGLAARPDVRTIVPIRPVDTYVFARFADEFDAYVSLATPPMETLRTVHDRVRLVDACEAAGVPAPKTARLGEIEDWNDEYIVKSRYNVLADAYLDTYDDDTLDVVKDVTHVRAGDAPDAATVSESMGHEPIVQEFVPIEDEYMFGGLYNHGEPVATFQHKQLRGNSYTGGGGVYRRSMYDEELERVARTLLDHLDYHGLACIEYMKHAETGEYVITELNPRMWQSLSTAVRAGADFPYYYWLQALGRTDEVDAGYDLGVGSHLLSREAQHLVTVLTDDSDVVERPSFVGRAWEIAASCVREPRFDILRADDPRPFVRGFDHMLASARSVLGSALRPGGRRSQ